MINISYNKVMNLSILTKIINGIFFYIGWCLCVIGAANGWGNKGAAFCLIFIAFHFLVVKDRFRELVLMSSLVIAGFLIDTIFLNTHLLVYEEPNPIISWGAPLWILSIYALFSTSINGSLSWLQHQLLIAAIFGAGGGVFSYLFGERVGAVTFTHSVSATVIIIAAVWFFLFPLIVLYNQTVIQKIRN